MKPQIDNERGSELGLDALLGRWPAQDPQEKGGATWEERADKIVAAALALKDQGSPEVLDTLGAAPKLDPEPGEDKAGSYGFPSIPVPAETGKAPKKSSDQGKRLSLKELAARASQAGAARSTPPPPVSATVTPIAKARAASSSGARKSDAGREDSGILRLEELQAKSAPEKDAAPAPVVPIAAAAAAAPAQASVASDKAASSSAPGRGGKGGMVAGIAIAVLGIAAAFAVYQTRKPESASTPTVADVTPTSAPSVAEAPKPVATSQPVEVASAEPTAEPGPNEESNEPDPSAPAAAVVASNDFVGGAAPKAKPKGGPVGTLDEEMKKAVGSNDPLPSAPQDDGSKPAAGGGANVPEQPSQGNAQAAIRAVLPSAKACVAGAPEPSMASVTFGSSGAVKSITVGGWAAANGKSGCVKSALQGAHVAPFAKPTFTVPVTIRP